LLDARDQASEIRDQRTEIRDQKSEKTPIDQNPATFPLATLNVWPKMVAAITDL
jgi:hypothetical protein